MKNSIVSKIVVFILIILMLFTFTGCGSIGNFVDKKSNEVVEHNSKTRSSSNDNTSVAKTEETAEVLI